MDRLASAELSNENGTITSSVGGVLLLTSNVAVTVPSSLICKPESGETEIPATSLSKLAIPTSFTASPL